MLFRRRQTIAADFPTVVSGGTIISNRTKGAGKSLAADILLDKFRFMIMATFFPCVQKPKSLTEASRFGRSGRSAAR
jgi:hypothetical protein